MALLYWCIGFLTFIPLEIFQGFYLGYVLILLLGFVGVVRAGWVLITYFFFILCVLFATAISADPSVTSIVNPIITSFAIILAPAATSYVREFAEGFVVSACMHAILLGLFLSFYGPSNIIALLTDRLWAQDYLPYFGNGFAMLFPFAIILALALSEHIRSLLLCIGGVLTTSRIPLVFAFVAGAFSVRTSKYAIFFALVVAGTAFVMLSDEVLWFYEGFSSRLLQSNDRIDVYSLVLTEIVNSPLIGHGPLEIEYYGHAHNSVLHVGYRYGVLAAGVWLVLGFLAFFRANFSPLNVLFLIALGLVSLTQIGLFHPNVVLAALFTRWRLDCLKGGLRDAA